MELAFVMLAALYFTLLCLLCGLSLCWVFESKPSFLCSWYVVSLCFTVCLFTYLLTYLHFSYFFQKRMFGENGIYLLTLVLQVGLSLVDSCPVATLHR